METVLVIGGGNQGYALSSHLALSGCKVNLWNRTEANILSLIKYKTIEISGEVVGLAKLNKVSSDIKEVITNVIFITTPSSAHKQIAELLAPFVDNNSTIILTPGRTFGALCFQKDLINSGCAVKPRIFETQTIIHTCRKLNHNKVQLYALKKDVLISSLRSNDLKSLVHLPIEILKYYKLTSSMIETSLGNVGMILHCAPMLLNVGYIESNTNNFKYYFEGISKTIANFLEKLDKERVSVAKELGLDLESTDAWLKRTYNVRGNNLYECIQNNQVYKDINAPKTLQHRYIIEDIPNGLVPLESIAKYYGIETPNISLIISLANSILDIDFRSIGRKLTSDDIKEYFVKPLE